MRLKALFYLLAPRCTGLNSTGSVIVSHFGNPILCRLIRSLRSVG
jgi:hypothetical protein